MVYTKVLRSAPTVRRQLLPRARNLISVSRVRSATKRVVANTRKKMRVMSLEDSLVDIFGTFRKLVDQPTSLMMILVVITVIATHTDNMSEGWLKDLANKYPNNAVLNFIKVHFKQFLGCIIHVCVLIDLPRSSNKLLIGAATLLALFMLPPYNVYQYALLAMLLHAYFRVYLSRSRTVLIVLAFLLLAMGFHWLGSFEHPYMPAARPRVARSTAEPAYNDESASAVEREEQRDIIPRSRSVNISNK